MITISIDVTKIDKSRIKEINGAKYLDLTLIDTPNSQYGDHYMVVQKSTLRSARRASSFHRSETAKTGAARTSSKRHRNNPRSSNRRPRTTSPSKV